MKTYYIYALCDSSKFGSYQYDDLFFDYEPFYIGKGTEDRNYNSIFDSHNSFKKNKIKSLKKKKIDILSLKLIENLSNEESLKIETEIIRKIGRRNLDKGPLTNLTDGGDGRLNSPHSEETKMKISDTKKSQNLHNKHNQETIEHLRKINQGENNPFFGKHHTEEVREAQSNRVLGINHPMWGKKHGEETLRKIREKRNQSVVQEKLNQFFREFNSKPVLQFNLDGEFIKEFNSIKDAAKEVGCSESIIGKCCRGIIKNPRKYIFKFGDEKSLELKNSFVLKIGDEFEIENKKYRLIKRNKSSAIGEIGDQLVSFRKKDTPQLFEKIRIDR